MQGIPRFNVSNRSKKDDVDENLKLLNRPPLASSTVRSNGNTKTDDLKLGFANLPEQMQRKAVKKGFNFTLMIVGESGLGKSTFVNSLLNQTIYSSESRDFSSQEMIQSTTKIEKHFIELDEKGVKLRLTIVDTPGFGDGVDCRECWKPVVDYIDETFYQYFKDECAINRKNIQDNRVHCCLYFVSPVGHGLKPLDVELMRCLQHKVNIVPIIAKADSLTEAELSSFKRRVIADLDKWQINFYQPPICGSDEEDEFRAQDAEIRAALPFSVIGSNVIVEGESGRRLRGRQYPWGLAELDNSRHCNFNILRTFVLRTHMQDLKDVTSDLLYENYRGQIIQVKMNNRYATMNSKTESTASSIDDIVDTSNLLQEKDEDISRIHAVLSKMQTQLSNGSMDSGSINSSVQYASNRSFQTMPPATAASMSTVTAPSTGSPAVSVKSSSTISSAK